MGWKMIKNIIKSLLLLIIFTIILGLLYPLVITGISKIIFPKKSAGSLIYNGDKIIGSELIGQSFSGEKYFHSRPSSAGQDGYDSMSSAGSNLAPTNKDFILIVGERINIFRRENYINDGTLIPSDIVTASGSGLDPHISVDSALLQIKRISKIRSIPEEKIEKLVLDNIETRQLGFLGELKINVLKLNLLLDNL